MAVLRDLLAQSLEAQAVPHGAPALPEAFDAFRAAVLAGRRHEETEHFQKFIDLAEEHLEGDQQQHQQGDQQGTVSKWKAEELAEWERLRRLEERLIQGEQELLELESAMEENEVRVGKELLSSMLAAGDTGSSCDSEGSSGLGSTNELPGVDEVEWRRNQRQLQGMVLLDERPEVQAVAQATPGASEMMAPCGALPTQVELEGGVWRNWDGVIRDRSNLPQKPLNGRHP